MFGEVLTVARSAMSVKDSYDRQMLLGTKFNPPKPMSRAERISWCIILTKQSLRDCGLFNWRSRRKLKSKLQIYESGRFPGEVVK